MAEAVPRLHTGCSMSAAGEDEDMCKLLLTTSGGISGSEAAVSVTSTSVTSHPFVSAEEAG